MVMQPLRCSLNASLAAAIAILALGCEREYSRWEMNPRKEAIYTYVSSLCERDQNRSVMSFGPMGAPVNHPSLLKVPYPTRGDMEAAIGKADRLATERVKYIVIGGLGKEEEEDDLVLTWWERDTKWETYGAKGWEKLGHREIVKAWIDPEGRLKKLLIVFPRGTESIGRHPGFWEWAG